MDSDFIICAGILLIIFGAPIVTDYLDGCPLGEKECGSGCYKTENQSCCSGKTYEGKSWASCGDYCYDYLTQSCCNAKVYEGHWFNCNGTCYNSSEWKSCCNGVLHKDGNWKTCNGSCYNSLTHDCCNGEIMVGKSWINCGETCIDSNTQVCCSKTICQNGYKCCYDRQEGPTCYNPRTHYCIKS